MAFIKTDAVKICGISSCVPKQTIQNLDYPIFFSEPEKKKLVKNTGIKQRRIATETTTASDLCFFAASQLLEDMHIDKSSIDVLIFLSQTPDYSIPMTSTILQHRLKLSKTTAAFDLNIGCSGFTYGLSVAFSFASQNGVNRVLFLIGETLSKILSEQDKSTTLLFGDGASAILIEKSSLPYSSYFSLNSDGSGEDAIKIPYGGYRSVINQETLEEKLFEDGSVRTGLNLTMNGGDVFDFTVKEIINDIEIVLNFSKKQSDEIDYFIFHQSNIFIINFLAKKLNIPQKKNLINIDRFGNTSGVSIPLAITTELKDVDLTTSKQVLLSGYGAGLSWGTVVLTLQDCWISPLIEV